MRRMARHLFLALLASATLAGCGGSDPPRSPDTGTPSGDVQVSGRERIGWNQVAADSAELGVFQYVIYIDGSRTVLNGVTCDSTATAGGFPCSAPLPALTAGRHTLELATVLTGSTGGVESDRSSALNVVMTGAAQMGLAAVSPSVTTAEGATFALRRIAEGLHDPSDIAFAADGTMFVAERGGMVRAIRDGVLLPGAALDLTDVVVAPRGGLLAIALDQKFDETGFMYALYAVDAPRDGLEFLLARFREVQGRFAERATLLDRIAASPDGASGALRIGPDGKLYVALDNAADAAAAASTGTYNGKILRLNADATTPSDQPASSPIHSSDHPEPKAMDWHPASGDLWVIDGVDPSGGRVRRAASRTGYSLPQGTGASAAAFYRGSLMPMFRGNLFIAAEAGRQLMRLRLDPEDPTRVSSVDRLLKDEIGPVRVVAEGRDGALYIASDTALYRLAP